MKDENKMAVITWEKKERIAVVTMCNGANKQNPAFVSDFNRCVDQAVADADVDALVLTSSDDKNFCQGIDTDWLTEKIKAGEHDEVRAFLHGMNGMFKRLLLLEVPAVAAITGHAFGNGAMLACACDFRFMRKDKGFFCFPEVDISIPFLPGMVAFVRKAVPEHKFNEMLLTGKRAGAQEMADCHVLEKASENVEELMADALAFAGEFHKKRGIFGELKKRKHKSIIEIMETEDVKLLDALALFA
jgi:enoyl-CoA hydratase/carnithine racemase